MDSDQKYLVEDMEVMSDFELHNFCLERRLLSNFKLAKEQIYESGKFLQLDKILPEIANEVILACKLYCFAQLTRCQCT